MGTRHGGIAEAVLEGQTGFLVPPREPEQIGVRLTELLADEGRCRQLGRQARARIEEYFNAERMAAQSEAHLREMAG